MGTELERVATPLDLDPLHELPQQVETDTDNKHREKGKRKTGRDRESQPITETYLNDNF